MLKRTAFKQKVERKRCKCSAEFKPANTFQKDCIPCLIKKGKKEQKRVAKVKKAEDAAFKKKVRDKDHPWHIKTLERLVNRYICLRDKDLPCISCDRPADAPIQWSAGHYFSVGSSPELRFELLNIHKQCWFNCNKNRGGNIAQYRPRLVLKIGEANVAWLEGPHKAKNYTIPELNDLIAEYRLKNKELAT